MAGFRNEVVYGSNVDFSGVAVPAATMLTNGQLLIGSTALNAGNTHINVGNIISPLGTISVGYSSPNITVDVTGGTNTIIQQVRTASTTSVSSTKVLASTGTTPTTTNSDLIISLSCTPTSATNVLVFDFTTPFSCDVDSVTGFFLFSGTTFLSAFPLWQNGAGAGAERNTYMNFTYYMVSGTTSATTYSVYWAQSQAGGTLRTLKNSAGTDFYGGAANTATQLIITEYKI